MPEIPRHAEKPLQERLDSQELHHLKNLSLGEPSRLSIIEADRDLFAEIRSLKQQYGEDEVILK